MLHPFQWPSPCNFYSFEIAKPVAGNESLLLFISTASSFSCDFAAAAVVLKSAPKLPLLLELFTWLVTGTLFLLSFLGASVGFEAWFLSVGGGPFAAGIGGGRGEGGIGGASSSIRSA